MGSDTNNTTGYLKRVNISQTVILTVWLSTFRILYLVCLGQTVNLNSVVKYSLVIILSLAWSDCNFQECN